MQQPAPGPDDNALSRHLAMAGLLPLVLLAALLWLLEQTAQTWAAIAMTAYAALVVALLGGVHWGLGWLAQHRTGASTTGGRNHFLWGMATLLLAWPGLLMPAHAGLAWLGFLLILGYLADRTLYRRAGLQAWLTLRFRLTAIAAMCCFIGAGAL